MAKTKSKLDNIPSAKRLQRIISGKERVTTMTPCNERERGGTSQYPAIPLKQNYEFCVHYVREGGTQHAAHGTQEGVSSAITRDWDAPSP